MIHDSTKARNKPSNHTRSHIRLMLMPMLVSAAVVARRAELELEAATAALEGTT